MRTIARIIAGLLDFLSWLTRRSDRKWAEQAGRDSQELEARRAQEDVERDASDAYDDAVAEFDRLHPPATSDEPSDN